MRHVRTWILLALFIFISGSISTSYAEREVAAPADNITVTPVYELDYVAANRLNTERLLAATPPGTPISSEAARQRTAKWTIMIYMAADNDLEPFALADINEMEFVGSTEEINVVVQIDRSDRFDTTNGDWSDTRRFFITRDASISQIGSEQLESIGEINTGDPAPLTDFGTWGIETFPAERYALIIWDHGSSWLGVASDDNSDYDDLSLPELESALAGIQTNTGVEKLDMIGFDACLMGAFEVFAAVAPYGNYTIASTELIPGTGLDYFGMLASVTQTPDESTEAFGQAIIDSFYTFYTETVTNYEVFALTLANLNEVDEVLSALQELSDTIEASPTNLDAIGSARNRTRVFGAFGDPQFTDIWAAIDMEQFTDILTTTPLESDAIQAAQDVRTASDNMLVYYRGSNELQNASGVSIYFPRSLNFFQQNDFDDRYKAEVPLERWEQFLENFYTMAVELGEDDLNGDIVSLNSEEGVAEVELAFDEPNLNRSSFLVLLDIGNDRTIVIDYSHENNQLRTRADWDGKVKYLTDGDLEAPVLLIENPNNERVGIVNGLIHRLQEEEPVVAQAVINLETRRATSYWGVRRTSGGFMPTEIFLQPGDYFEPTWLSLQPNGQFENIDSGVHLKLEEENPLELIDKDAPEGKYRFLIRVTNFAGESEDEEIEVVARRGEGGQEGQQRLSFRRTDDNDDNDLDEDGITDDVDNCPATANPEQEDLDEDGIGDACDFFDDTDFDEDGIPDFADNCPETPNPNQRDADLDEIGDLCDPTPLGDDPDEDGFPDVLDACPDVFGVESADGCPDADEDGIEDDFDNCPDTPNPFQEDSDDNGVGDACEETTEDNDIDGDGVLDIDDNCPRYANPLQLDENNDGIGDACSDIDNDGVFDSNDNCIDTPNSGQADYDLNDIGDACDDFDGDTVFDDVDNCIEDPNPEQSDVDFDGIGDVCDPTNDTDTDGDGVPDETDNCANTFNPGQANNYGGAPGDACEDSDGDSFLDNNDSCPLTPGSADGCPDSDGDGFADSVDSCPGTPGVAPDGCPPPDSDGDGIIDSEDECPATPGDASANGCPDMDGDGIQDLLDACPMTPGDASANGCPDADGDGIEDALDACVNQPGPPATSGCPDSDGDGVADSSDNCPFVANPGQTDTGGGAAGDACEDRDGDGIVDASDSCPDTTAFTADGCPPPDSDGDGVPDGSDNCPGTPNPGQANNYGGGAGDACEDSDGDGFLDNTDSCPTVPGASSANGCPDGDTDGVPDSQDNCPFSNNAGQEDLDGDGLGDVCDPNPNEPDE